MRDGLFPAPVPPLVDPVAPSAARLGNVLKTFSEIICLLMFTCIVLVHSTVPMGSYATLNAVLVGNESQNFTVRNIIEPFSVKLAYCVTK